MAEIFQQFLADTNPYALRQAILQFADSHAILATFYAESFL